MKLRHTATITAIALSAAFLPPAAFSADTVYSVNVVGIQKVSSPSQNLEIVSTPFLLETNDLNNVVGDQLTGGDFASSDKIHIFNPGLGLYQTFYKTNGIWQDNLGQIATNLVPPGTAFWVQNFQTTNQTIVFVGDVVADETVSININPGLQIVANPYSAPIPLNGSSLTNGVGGDFANSDKVHIFDSGLGLYQTFFLTNGVWKDNTLVDASVDLDPNIGFWYQHVGSGFTWVEEKPYTNP